MTTEFSHTNIRAICEMAGDIEQDRPSRGGVKALCLCYEWLDLAREAGVDVDAVIDEVRG